jgi:hypothetical protein
LALEIAMKIFFNKLIEYLFKKKKIFSFRSIVNEPLKPIPEVSIKLINNSIISGEFKCQVQHDDELVAK